MHVVIYLLIFGAVSLGVLVAVAPGAGEVTVQQRLATMRRQQHRPAAEAPPEDEELAKPFSERIVGPMLVGLAQQVVRLTPQGMLSRVRTRLVQAGRPMEPGRFMTLKVLGAAVPLALFALLPAVGGAMGATGEPASRLPLLGLVLTVLGFRLPELWLSQQLAGRRKQVRRALPDVLDLLSVSVEAGLGLDGAIQKVSEKFSGPTGEEFREYLKEVRVGKTRADALRALASRTALPELRSLVAAIIQADELGVSMTRVLRVQSEQMRQRRRQQAEERAMKTPVKMLFPLIIFIFPTVFIVILGPAVIRFIQMFAG